MSVSRLYPGVLDEDEGASDSFDPSSFDLSPEFAREGAQMADSAQKGTATHLVMQFANFERMKKTGVASKLLCSFGVTDESFAIFTTTEKEKCDKWYFFGVFLGTYFLL